MKKLLALVFAFILVFSVFAGCEETIENPQATSTPYVTPTPTEPPKDVAEKTDYVTEQWIVIDIPFTANTTVKNITSTELDVTFKNRSTGTTLKMPGFWDGGKDWKVRFAPTECGIWDYETVTTGEDIGISGIKGTLASNAYKGDLAIYKHGFVTTKADTKYFVYADGTPFFYLGDTHWSMAMEECSDKHFKYIVDRRVAQGFTVYQSEPIGAKFDVNDGRIMSADVIGFQDYDKYFQYIAEKGLVHANAQLLFPSGVTKNFCDNVRSLTRYWVARYAAYPVMWTLGQEVDDANTYNVEGAKEAFLEMAKYIDEFDPYNSPLSAHQLNATKIGCLGNVSVSGIDFGYADFDTKQTEKTGTSKKSIYYDVKGHTWWAAQWRPLVHTQYNFDIPKDYWENGQGKPIVDYESRYHKLSAGDYGARVQSYLAYLNGMFGYGYGALDMWYYNYEGSYISGYDSYDGITKTTKNEKMNTTWEDMIDAPIANEMTYLRGFFENIGWWNLTPDFDNGNAFKKDDSKKGYYCAAYSGNEVYVVYLYNMNNHSAGKLVNMDKNATYVAQWFDTKTGKYTLIDANLKADENGEYDIPKKPSATDTILLVTKK